MALTQLWYDIETYYDQQYSLHTITPVEYILGQQFEALGCSFAFDDGAPFWVDGPHLPAFLDTIDWDNTEAVCHNGLFDHIVLAWRYHKSPKRYGDSMAMARAWVYHRTGSVALKDLAKWFGKPPKWGTLLKTKGKHYDDLLADPVLHEEVKLYAIDDLDKCRHIYRSIMAEGYPQEQLDVIDMVVRMAAEPKFLLDLTVLYEYLAKVKAEKDALLARVGLDCRDPLMSDEQFAALLYAAGVEPPVKTSPTTGDEVWAFAKSDKRFTDLEEHDDPHVQALVAARLGHKSTIEETRTERLIAVSNATWHNGTPPCSLPVPLKVSGAHTHRFSGDWKFNLQNLRRGGELRKAIKARPGEKIVSVDASQIEARVLATLAGQIDLVQAFLEGRDVYAEFGTDVFRIPVTKETAPRERFIGKTAVLQLGYGAGWMSFQGQVRVNSRASGDEIVIGDNEAQKVVQIYRQKNNKIKAYWDYWDNVIALIADPKVKPFMAGPVEVTHQELILPNGLGIRYHDLRRQEYYGKVQWVYTYGRMTKVLYGAKVVENIVQALAFYHIESVALRAARLTDRRIMMAHQVHDELLFAVPEVMADPLIAFIKDEVARRPVWLPDCPLASEGGAGDNYYEVK
jgi:hypothetical protein